MMAPPAAVPTLPLRADVLLSNALFQELDNGISADFLRHCTGQEDLELAEFVELQVDAAGGSQRVECIGELLPSLQQLRLNQSSICTIRDLGTSLTRLRVLWLCRSSLQDLGGVSALPVLEELYVSFNDIRELSPLGMHESLQVLDLEGNLVEDLEEVRALQAVASLRELTLSLNPLARRAALRVEVLAALPQLEVLDDAPRGAPPRGAGAAGAAGPEARGAAGAGEGAAHGGLDVEELFAEEPLAPGPSALEESLALRRLRERAAAAAGATGAAAPPAAPSGPPAPEAAGQAPLRALGRLRAERARLLAAPGGGEGASPAEPSEHDLVVERLKRAARPAPGAWRYAASARPAGGGGRPPTGFFPDRRPITAWSSGRPTTASSGTGAASSRSLALSGGLAESEAASDLTAGDDGAALAGNPLSAARRRRRVAATRGEDELSIWNLMRRTEAEADASEGSLAQALPEGRMATPDVRIGPSRLLATGSFRTATRSPALCTAAAPPAGCVDVPAPSVATGSTEVLYLE